LLELSNFNVCGLGNFLWDFDACVGFFVIDCNSWAYENLRFQLGIYVSFGFLCSFCHCKIGHMVVNVGVSSGTYNHFDETHNIEL
jgi:hypothetical protein